MATKRYRRLSREATQEEGIESGPWELASCFAVFYHKQKRRRDDVNHLAMLKPAYDGMVEARLLEDDDSEHLKTLTPEFRIDRQFPRVELTITREE